MVLMIITACARPPDPDTGPISSPGEGHPPPSSARLANGSQTPPGPVADPHQGPTGLSPNELGRIPILVYHQVGDREGRWMRRWDNFARDLQALYDRGYRLVSLNDYLDGRLSLPAGYSPVILTFDDSSRGQFNYLLKDGREAEDSPPVVDPHSAVGVLLDFYRSHPDFGLEATFYFNASPFGQPELWKEKLRFLLEQGLDLGNHTDYHVNLARATSEEVRRALAAPVKILEEVAPGYRLTSLALPYGAWPADSRLAVEGEFQGVRYSHRGILLVGAAPAPSPYSLQYDPLRLPRIQAFSPELERWLDYLDRHPDDRYVSDGDPEIISFPVKLQGKLNQAAVKGKQVLPLITGQ